MSDVIRGPHGGFGPDTFDLDVAIRAMEDRDFPLYLNSLRRDKELSERITELENRLDELRGELQLYWKST